MSSTNFNNLELTFKTSILDGIQLKEKIDIDLLDKLINSNLLKETFNNPMSKIYKTEKHQLQKELVPLNRLWILNDLFHQNVDQ